MKRHALFSRRTLILLATVLGMAVTAAMGQWQLRRMFYRADRGLLPRLAEQPVVLHAKRDAAVLGQCDADEADGTRLHATQARRGADVERLHLRPHDVVRAEAAQVQPRRVQPLDRRHLDARQRAQSVQQRREGCERLGVVAAERVQELLGG